MIWHHWNFYFTAPNSTNCWCGTEGFKMAVAHKRGATESQVASRPGNKAASPGGGCVMSKHPKHQHSRNITEDECRVIRGSMYTVMSQFVNIMHCPLMHFHKCPSPLRGQRSMKMVGNLPMSQTSVDLLLCFPNYVLPPFLLIIAKVSSCAVNEVNSVSS